MATILNNHYAKISTDTLYTAPPKKTNVTSQEEHFTECEVFKHLDSLRATATGLDQLPAWFLRLGASVSAKHLARLFNRSVSDSVVPEQYVKQVYIRPIQKIPTPSRSADYIPISITPVLIFRDYRTIVSFETIGKASRKTLFLPRPPESSTNVVFCGPVLLSVLVVQGAVHKVCHAPRGRGSEKVWQFVTGEGVKIMWRHTFNFFTIHNFMFYIIYFIMHNTNLSCNYHLRSCKKLNF